MTTTYAGMDAHARTIWVAVLAPGAGKPEEWQLTNEPRAVKRLAQRLKRMAPGPVVACYEAGPGGFALQRQLEAERIECRVIAPATGRPREHVRYHAHRIARAPGRAPVDTERRITARPSHIGMNRLGRGSHHLAALLGR